MPWIKRNLVLVVGGVIALALLGLAGYYLFQNFQKDRAVTETLDLQIATFKELVNRPVHPGTPKVDNIGKAKKEHEKLLAFLAEQKKFFSAPITNSMNAKDFRALLDRTIDRLQKEAAASGVTLPAEGYWFTFAAQKSVVNFPTNAIDALTTQLHDITVISDILYKAKVPSILSLKRVPVTMEDSALGSPDYTMHRAVTNNYAIITPYEVSFTGFSSELDDVLEQFIRTGIVTKNLLAEKAGLMVTNYNPNLPAPGPFPQRFQREGMPLPPPRAMRPAAPRPGGLVTVLDENKLKFSLHVEVVKLRPPGARLATPPADGTDPAAVPAEPPPAQ